MATVDVYRITDKLDDPTLDAVAARLEARGKHPRFIAMMQEYVGAMGIDAAATVLDLGCGTGVASRAIAQRKAFAGRVTGIDRSAYLIAAAKRFATQEGVADVTEFRTGDSQSLNLPNAAFDAVIAHTLISHVEDPASVLREMARIVKPHGRIGIFDGDYASLTYGTIDPATGKVTDEMIINALVTNPRVMREMPYLLKEAGLVLEASFAHVVADIGRADFFAPGLQSLVRVLPKSGAMSESEARAWVNAMLRQSEEGTYFGASNFYSYVARRN
jgi:ubiquinone/menaquinone biosynthesis C-methylase UbiE